MNWCQRHTCPPLQSFSSPIIFTQRQLHPMQCLTPAIPLQPLPFLNRGDSLWCVGTMAGWGSHAGPSAYALPLESHFPGHLIRLLRQMNTNDHKPAPSSLSFLSFYGGRRHLAVLRASSWLCTWVIPGRLKGCWDLTGLAEARTMPCALCSWPAHWSFFQIFQISCLGATDHMRPWV